MEAMARPGRFSPEVRERARRSTWRRVTASASLSPKWMAATTAWRLTALRPSIWPGCR